MQPQRMERPRRRHRKLARFCRGYLMTVGGLTTFYVLVRLLVVLFVEVNKWFPSAPLM